MSATTNDYENLRHYLLGQLPEEEEQALEARLLADSELFELAEATEAELLDECFRGELAREEGQGLIRRLSASTGGRRRIALAQGLVAITPSQPEPATVLPFRPRFLARPAVRTALAAALVGAAVAVWQVYPGAPKAPPPRSHGQGSEQVASQPRLPLPPRPPRPSPLAEAPPQVFALSLITLRDGGELLPELPISPEKTRVELQLKLSKGETFAAYDVSLRREGEDVWGPRRLAAPATPGAPGAPGALGASGTSGASLAVLLSASALAAGTYEVEVRGVAPDGSTELVGNPSFRVIR